MPLNIEIKARCPNPEKAHRILQARKARFIGIDRQTDTYFRVNRGRLKLREGNIENHLIYYQRDNLSGPKKSEVMLFKTEPESSLKDMLIHSMGIMTVVDKQRAIYFIENVKFHIDKVAGLGSFIEIEAIDHDGTIGESKLAEQCRSYMDIFEIQKDDLIETSYSDLVLEK